MSLQRPHKDRIIAGVAAGIAKRFDLPIWLVRLVFLILIPLPPSALLVYIGLWILIPKEPEYTVLP